MAAASVAYGTPALAEPAPLSVADRAFRPDIEGLRAVAVLLVIAAHAGLGSLAGGFVGVDVFFVISGFLITGLLLKSYEVERRISLAGFYARRVRRILPAATLVLLATMIGSALWLGAHRAAHIAGDARWAALFAANIDFIQQSTNYLDAQLPPSPLQHYWSLGVEEQFYAVWPLAMMLIACIARRIPLRLKLGVALAIAVPLSLWWSIAQTATNGAEAYFSPLTRAWELGAGALLAIAAPWLPRLPRLFGIVLSLAGVLTIACAALLFTPMTPFPSYTVLLPAGGAALVVAGGTVAPGGGAEHLLRLGVFQSIGRLSYSLYLWHWPLLTIAQEHQGHNLPAGETVGLCLLALALSAATFRLVEQPVRISWRLKRRGQRVSIALGICLVALTFAAATGFITWLTPPATPAHAPAQVVFP